MMPHFLAIENETAESLRELLAHAVQWKAQVKRGSIERVFAGHPGHTSPRVLTMLFEKPSTRTRMSFEMAMHHMGGNAIYLSPFEVGLGKRESTRDVAEVIGRYTDAIMARVFNHEDVELLARHAGVPVINGLSDREHPCQAAADFLTIEENRTHEDPLTLAFVGDGNNVCHSLMFGAALLGIRFIWVGPEGYEPDKALVAEAENRGLNIELANSFDAIEHVDFVYTDVWASMGQEEEARERRVKFEPFRLDGRVFDLAPRAKVLHCLPAHRGDEVTDEVLDSDCSVVFDQAENRLYGQMAVLERLLPERP